MKTPNVLKFHSIEDFGGADSSHRLFTTWGWESVANTDDADIIIFNGGADIATEIYKERPAAAYVPRYTSVRDDAEIAIFDEYKNSGKFLLGICRGAQLLNCLNGGFLWQDVNNHGRSHNMIDVRTGEVLWVTSTHHQMMRPNLVDGGILIGVASESDRKIAQDIDMRFTPKSDLKTAIAGNKPTFLAAKLDPEIVWYPQTNTLCIQGHPEYVPSSRFAYYCRELIETCMAEAKVTA